MGFFGEFSSHKSKHFVVFEDDGRVAYAYLYDANRQIVGDVWLYNRCVTPREPEWKDKEKLPFANPKVFVKENLVFAPVDDLSEVKVEWEYAKEGNVTAKFFIRDIFFAVLTEGSKPGYSLLAAKNGPLAKVLDSKPHH